MAGFPIVLAEVSDKMMSWPILTLWSFGLVLLAWALSRKKKWRLVIPLPFAALLAFAMFEELHDPDVGPAVISELGYCYVALPFLPLLAIAVLLLSKNKKSNQSPESVSHPQTHA